MRSLIPSVPDAVIPEPAPTTPSRPCLPDAVLAQAVRHPARAAVVHGDTELTYSALTGQAAGLAAQLREAGVTRETTVAICLPRGTDLVTAVLGVWFAGGACLMIDPAGPPKRCEHMLRDSGAAIVITLGDLAAGFPGLRTLLIPQTTNARYPAGRRPSPAVAQPRADDLAYVMYTSGTTGLPKGVMVEHGTLATMADSTERVLHASPTPYVRRVALNSGTSADTLFADLVNLAYGRTLVVVDEETRRNPERLGQLLADSQVELLLATPTQIRALLLASGVKALDPLRVLVLGSEAIDPALWQQMRDLPDLRTFNLYGPTETTVCVTIVPLADHPEPVIGAALPGTRIWIADKDLRVLADGEVGEICVTGAQLARGYRNAGPAERARFTTIRVPGATAPLRTYRTGDRGRYNAVGQLEFLGRIDSQVSLSGHRVELGEIEAVLRSCPEVANAAVGLAGDGDRAALAAWVVLATDARLDQVRTALQQSLPMHMIPRLAPVAAIPMNAAGKADIQALAAASVTDNATPAPAEGLPALLQNLWSSALGLENINDGDDFFALGGDSLKATRMIVATRQLLALDLPIRTIFDHPCFADFHHAISQEQASRIRPTSNGALA